MNEPKFGDVVSHDLGICNPRIDSEAFVIGERADNEKVVVIATRTLLGIAIAKDQCRVLASGFEEACLTLRRRYQSYHSDYPQTLKPLGDEG